MKARFGVALFGVGVLLLVLAAGLAFFVAPSVTKLPYDLVACGEGETGECLTPSVAQADGATFLQTKAEGGQLEIAVHTGTLTATTEVDPQADRTAEELTGDLAGEAVVWEVFGTVKRDNGEVINQYIADLAIDRVSAEAREWDKQALEDQGREGPTTVEFEGQTYQLADGRLFLVKLDGEKVVVKQVAKDLAGIDPSKADLAAVGKADPEIKGFFEK